MQIAPTIRVSYPFAVAVDRNGKIYVTSDYKGGSGMPLGRIFACSAAVS
jgi:hypothetical protein